MEPTQRDTHHQRTHAVPKLSRNPWTTTNGTPINPRDNRHADSRQSSGAGLCRNPTIPAFHRGFGAASSTHRPRLSVVPGG
jgi:hypothetical protein